MKGISTNRKTSGIANCLKGEGVSFVVRYYSYTTTQPEKRLTRNELDSLIQAGIQVAVVYEDGPTKIEYFSTERGSRDLSHALLAAKSMNQPTGSAIYFAVDEDFTGSSAFNNHINPYFEAIGTAMAANGRPYRVGVYGSGHVCSQVKALLGPETLTWVAESTGWTGTSTYTDWDIKQKIAGGSICGLSGKDYEDCESKGADFGQFASTASIENSSTSIEVIERVLTHAKSDLGVQESPLGSNSGPRVDAMLANTGLSGGYKWCAAAVATWGIEALGGRWPLPRSASCDDLLSYGSKHGVIHNSPKPGDVFLRLQSPTDATHTGFVLDADGSESSFRTIEGNSGDSVQSNTLSTSGMKFLRWIDLIDDIDSIHSWKVQVGSAGKWLDCELRDGKTFVQLRALLETCFDKLVVKSMLGWNGSYPTWGEVPLPSSVEVFTSNSLAYVGVRAISSWLGLSVTIKNKSEITLVR